MSTMTNGRLAPASIHETVPAGARRHHRQVGSAERDASQRPGRWATGSCRGDDKIVSGRRGTVMAVLATVSLVGG
jgi:hypothetical protein